MSVIEYLKKYVEMCIRDRFSLSMTGLPRPFSYPVAHILQSEPHRARTMVWALSRSLAATLEIDVSFFSSGYLHLSVPRVPPHKLCIYLCVTEVHSVGFPHSEIVGSKDICSSPALIAAYHVFHRLSVPRHPPYALSCLTRLIHIGLKYEC